MLVEGKKMALDFQDAVSVKYSNLCMYIHCTTHANIFSSNVKLNWLYLGSNTLGILQISLVPITY